MGEPAIAWEDDSAEAVVSEDHRLHLRMLEAILFAAAQPMSRVEISARMPEGIDLDPLLTELQESYSGRGVILRRTDDRWAFRTAEDLAFVLKREVVQEKKLSRAAVETLSVIAYHQPATRAEIEEVRGVAVSPGTLDILLETGWIRLRGRRRTPGRPVTFGTTPAFLDHFGLESIGDLPGLTDLRAAGLIETLATPGEEMPTPDDREELRDDEDPLEQDFGGLDAEEEAPAETEEDEVGDDAQSDEADDGGQR
jgi:segregation and condensation protein B